MKSTRELFKTTADILAFTDRDGGDVEFTFVAGTPIWADLREGETRTLNGKSIEVVRFIVAGSYTLYWMPREAFLHSTKKAV